MAENPLENLNIKNPLRLIEIHDSIERFPYNNKYHLSKDYIPRDLKKWANCRRFCTVKSCSSKKQKYADNH